MYSKLFVALFVSFVLFGIAVALLGDDVGMPGISNLWCAGLCAVLAIAAMWFSNVNVKVPTTRRSIRVMDITMCVGGAATCLSGIIWLVYKGSLVFYVAPLGLAMIALSMMACAAGGHRVLVAAYLPVPEK